MQFFQHYKRIHGNYWSIYNNIIDYKHIEENIDNSMIIIVLLFITKEYLVDPVASKKDIYNIIHNSREETEQS